MSKQVREMKAAKSLKAFAVLRFGKPFAKIQVHYSDSGKVMVDVWAECYADCVEAGLTEMLVHQGSASGYGYDKVGAALSNSQNLIDFLMKHAPYVPSEPIQFTYDGQSIHKIQALDYVVMQVL